MKLNMDDWLSHIKSASNNTTNTCLTALHKLMKKPKVV